MLRERAMARVPETPPPTGFNSRDVKRFDPTRPAVRLYMSVLDRLSVVRTDPRDPNIDADALDWSMTPEYVAARAVALDGRPSPRRLGHSRGIQEAADQASRSARIAGLKASIPNSPQ